MSLMPALAALVRVIRHAKGLTQEQMSGAVEARHLHNIENARSSITIDRLEAVATKLEIDPATLIVLASALSKGLTDEQMLEVIQHEFQGLNTIGAREHIADHYEDGKVTRGAAWETNRSPETGSHSTCQGHGRITSLSQCAPGST
ncbi:helix-turn-helix domain-containing protein [Pseudomonas aeruginosa]|uniref:helix-turn-helix domain-containing protein n=1 Tax=Pseudomonas aeruginosa TaxID=287 RepID=UPI001F4996B2|nr:helix-turn-helix domain-containing protein [Pseudomonas aeruginosa]